MLLDPDKFDLVEEFVESSVLVTFFADKYRVPQHQSGEGRFRNHSGDRRGSWFDSD